eukprot:Nk52_evm2s1493 gene=Nk52_evmTU2s1493
MYHGKCFLPKGDTRKVACWFVLQKKDSDPLCSLPGGKPAFFELEYENGEIVTFNDLDIAIPPSFGLEFPRNGRGWLIRTGTKGSAKMTDGRVRIEILLTRE